MIIRRITQGVVIFIGLIFLIMTITELVPGAFDDACIRSEIGTCD
jgi:hypothetical protein